MTIRARIALTVFSQKHATRISAHPHTHKTDMHAKKKEKEKKEMLHVKRISFWCESAVAWHKTILSEKRGKTT